MPIKELSHVIKDMAFTLIICSCIHQAKYNKEKKFLYFIFMLLLLII